MWGLLARLTPVALVVAVGCTPGEQRKPTYPVRGKITAGSKPVANATIVLHPTDDAGPEAVRPRGTTAADGSFTLSTYEGNDGAPAGNYRVTVEQWLAGRPDEGPSNRLPAKYGKPESSGLTATVNATPTESISIELKK